MKGPKKRLKSEKPSQQQGFGRQLWRVIDGAVRDAFIQHPDYLSQKGHKFNCARRSIDKRVAGAVLSYLEQSKRGRSGE